MGENARHAIKIMSKSEKIKANSYVHSKDNECQHSKIKLNKKSKVNFRRIKILTISSQKIQHSILEMHICEEKKIHVKQTIMKTFPNDLPSSRTHDKTGKKMSENFKQSKICKSWKRTYLGDLNPSERDAEFMASTIHFENGLTKNSGATKFVNNHKKEQQNFVASSFKENKIIQKKSSHVLSRNSQEMWNEKNLIKKNIFESPVKEHNAFEIKTPKQFSNDRNYQNWRNDSPFARMKREKEEFVNTREKHNSPAYNLKPEDVSPFKKFLSTELSNHYYGFRKEDTVTQFSPRSFSSLATVPVEGSENELNSTIPFDNKDFGSTIQLDSSDEFYDSKTIILSTPFESCSDNRVNISQDLFSSPELSRGKAFYSNTNVNKNKTITLSPYSALLSPTISVLSGISSSNVSPFEKSTGKNLDFSVEQTAKTNTKLFNPAIFSKQVNNELKDFNDSQNFPTFDTQTFLANYSFEHETMTEKQKYAPLFNKKSSRYELHVFKNSFVGDSNKIKSNIRNAIAILDNIDI